MVMARTVSTEMMMIRIVFTEIMMMTIIVFTEMKMMTMTVLKEMVDDYDAISEDMMM